MLRLVAEYKIFLYFTSYLTFHLQIYFNMENNLNGRIDVLNSEMGDTTRSTKTFCTSRLIVA
jgi:hypothetical protein